MISRAALAAMLGLWGLPVTAGDLGALDRLHEPYNRVAKNFGVTSRLRLEECRASKLPHCRYVATGNVKTLAIANAGETARAGAIHFIFASDTDAEAFIEAVSVAMATWSPFTNKDQRTAALRELTEGIAERKPASTTLSGVVYRVAGVEGVGLVLALNREN